MIQVFKRAVRGGKGNLEASAFCQTSGAPCVLSGAVYIFMAETILDRLQQSGIVLLSCSSRGNVPHLRPPRPLPLPAEPRPEFGQSAFA